jgi:AcrR family transcriptional regulator
MTTVKENRERAKAERAAVTQSRIVDAASELFRERGYVATTIDAVAERAGVVVQTIYNAVGNKAAVLNAVFDATVSGPESPLSVPEFMRARMDAADGLEGAVEVLTDWLVDVNARAHGIHALIRQAAAIDADVAELERSRALRRLHNYEGAAARFRELGGVDAWSTDVEVAAAIWAVGHPDAYRALVLDSGWTEDAYRSWLRRSLLALSAS